MIIYKTFNITPSMLAIGLKGNDLLIYAYIASFGNKGYDAGNMTLANTFHITKRTAINSLHFLVEKGLLARHDPVDYGIDACRYVAINITI